MPDVSALCTPSTFINADGTGIAQIPVANFSPHPCIIQPGEVLGVVQNPCSWLDKPSFKAKAEAEKLVVLIGKLSQGWEKMESFPNKDEEDKLLGPKTAEVPESEMLPSSSLTSILDISPDAPPKIQCKVSELIDKHQDAFVFDNRL